MRTGSSMPPHAQAQSSRHPHNQSYRHLPVPKDSKPQNGRRPVYLHEHRRPPPRGDGVGGGAGGGGAGLLQGFPTAGRHQQVQSQQQQVPPGPGQGQGQGQPGPGFQWPSWASFRKQEGHLPPHGAGRTTPQAANGAGPGPGRHYSQQQPSSRQRIPRDLVAAAVSKSAHAPPLPSSLQPQTQTQGNNNTPHLDAYIASQLGGRAPEHHDEGVEEAMDNYHDNDQYDDDFGGGQSVKSMVTDYTAGTTWTAGTTTTYGGGMSVKTSTHVPKPDKAGYNRKWTDVAYKKYMLGMQFYRAEDYDQAEQCFNHVLRIRKSLRQDESNHPDVLNASKMESRITYMKKKMERAKRKKAKRDARRRRKREDDARMLLVQAEEDAAKLRQAAATAAPAPGLAPGQQPKSKGIKVPMKPPAVKGTAADTDTGANRKLGQNRSRSKDKQRPMAAASAGADTTEGGDDDYDEQSIYSSGSGYYGTTSGEDDGESDGDSYDRHNDDFANNSEGDNNEKSDISDLSASVYGKPMRRNSSTFNETQSAGTGTKEGDSQEGTPYEESMDDLYERKFGDFSQERARRSNAYLNGGTASSRRMQKRKEKRRSSTGALNNALIEEAVEKLSIRDNSTMSGDERRAEGESGSISQRLRSSYQRFDPEDTAAAAAEAAGGAVEARSGLRKQSSLQSFEFSKFMDAVKNLKGSLGDELQQPQDQEVERQNAKSSQPVVEKANAKRSQEEELSDDMSAESYESDGTPEDFDEEEFTKSLVASNDEEEDEEDDYDDEGNEDAYGDVFDEFTAASAPFSVVGGMPRSGDSIVSAMHESTASDWREEQSLVASMLRKSRRPSKARLRARDTSAGDDRARPKGPVGNSDSGDDDDDDQVDSTGGLSLEEWQKFKKAAQNIYSNANADADATTQPQHQQAPDQPAPPTASQDISREDSGITKPRDLELEREYSVVSSMVDTTASEWHSRQRVEQHAPDDVQALEDVSAGNYALATGSYKEARTRFVSALRKMVRILGPDHEEVSLIQEMLGDACARLGQCKEAHGHYQLARQNLQEKLGKHDRNVTRIMVSLGNLYFESGNFSRALKYHASILELRRENLDEDHPDVLESVEKCMEVHEAMVARAIDEKDNEMAFFHAREIIWLGLSSEAVPPSNIDEAQVLDLLQDVQNSYLEASLDNKAEQWKQKTRTYYKEAKKLLKQAGGSADVNELSAMMDNVAGILLKEKKTESALRCYEEKLEFLDRHKINDSNLLCDTLRKLGSLCNKCGRHEEAISYQAKAFGIYQSRLESSNDVKSDYERTVRSLGATHLASGNFQQSMKHFKSYLGVCAMPEKPFVLLTMGVLYSKMYQIAEALNCYRKALQLESISSGEEDKDTLASISHLQDIFLSTKKRPKDSTCYEKALDSQDMKQILVNLGYVQLKNRTHKKDDNAQLDRHARKSARHFAKEILGYLNTDGETLDITCVLRSMGNVLSRRRRYKEAIEYYEKFLASKKPASSNTDNGDGHGHQEMFESLTDLGTAYLKTKEKEKAFASFQKALDELELCSDTNQDGITVEDNLKKLVAKKDKDYAASYFIDVEYLMGLLICRLGMIEKASKMLGEVRNKKMESSASSGTPNTAKVFIDSSTLILLRKDIKAGKAAFVDGMHHLQQEKLPFFHPYMGQLRRCYGFLNSRTTAAKGSA